MQDADKLNNIPSQPFNQTRVLPEHQSTNLLIENPSTTSTLADELDAPAKIQHLQTKLTNLMRHIQTHRYAQCLEWFSSIFSKDSRTRQEAMNILMET